MGFDYRVSTSDRNSSPTLGGCEYVSAFVSAFVSTFASALVSAFECVHVVVMFTMTMTMFVCHWTRSVPGATDVTKVNKIYHKKY